MDSLLLFSLVFFVLFFRSFPPSFGGSGGGGGVDGGGGGRCEVDMCVCVLDVVLLDLHLNPFCGRLNSREEHKHKHSPSTHTTRSAVKAGEGPAEGEKGKEWRRRSGRS